MDPFAAALDAIFNAPGSLAATYFAAPTPAISVRIIVGQPSEASPFGRGRVVQSSHELQFRRSDVTPQEDALVTVQGASFLRSDLAPTDQLRLVGDPQLDVEGLTWTIGAVPV